MEYFLIFWAILGILIHFIPERRTLWFGAVVFFWLGIFYSVVIIWISGTTGLGQLTLGLWIVILLLGIPAFTLLSLPVWLDVMLIVNGIRLIRREGFSLRNCLALGLGVGIIAYFVVSPMTNGWLQIPVLNLLNGFFLIGVNMIAVELMMYFLTTVANSFHLSRRKTHAIIVLGAGLIGENVTPLLARRIERGISLWKQQEADCYLIMSGGKGDDEVISEAEAMKRYAMTQGIDEKWIIMEDQSTNTEENIRNSYDIISRRNLSKKRGDVAIVTNYFHIFRAMVLARTMGYACIGYGAHTKIYYSINAFLRDFIGYMVLTWKKQVTIYGILSIIHVLLWLAGKNLNF